MTFNQIKMALYATFLTNIYGYKLKKSTSALHKKKQRILYATTLLKKLNIKINLINPQKLPQTGKYLLVSNHRSIIDPTIIEMALKDTDIFGHWVSKKELYNSFFFGLFVRNGGSILLDRDSSNMNMFFSDIKNCVKEGNSIFIFPEGTRNTSDKKLSEFKEGSRIIALKNRLPILPIYIRTNASHVLNQAIQSNKLEQNIEVEVGEIIEYKDRSMSLGEAYKKQFNI
ncbi:1-acyl-sn-glycerol-3-phosphate acyltransferase [Sulfurimonas sp. MAG313]|nr:lysophospholipid acyltransferase family protein [Sulfurimonas sp. MAG313]MDF1880205.1 1-acyl-sn-glycerol-3-phosphate acyltransferase [Sulfurimonas sp. MAG313]